MKSIFFNFIGFFVDKGPSRLVNFGDVIIFLFLLPKDSLWCQYAIPRVPEILLTKKRINHRFYDQKPWCPRTSKCQNIAFWLWKPPPKPSKSCFSNMIYPRKVFLCDFRKISKNSIFLPIGSHRAKNRIFQKSSKIKEKHFPRVNHSRKTRFWWFWRWFSTSKRDILTLLGHENHIFWILKWGFRKLVKPFRRDLDGFEILAPCPKYLQRQFLEF